MTVAVAIATDRESRFRATPSATKTSGVLMPEININGPSGRIEARYHHEPRPGAPIAMLLHPHPLYGGTMNNQIVYALYYAFAERGFSTLRFNFRGIGRSQGHFDNGPGELSDAASALDWLQLQNQDSSSCWLAGVNFGTWIAMQLLMRRPEVEGFICVAPPANLYDYSFLAPCPSSGLLINGDKDRVVPTASVAEMSVKTKVQKGVKLEHAIVPGANHFFQDKIEDLVTICGEYIDRRVVEIAKAKREARA